MMIVLKASGADAEFIRCEAGAEWWEKNGGPSFIPDKTWKVLEEADCCFKGPTTTLSAPGTPRSVAISIRQRFGLYANVRPIRSFPNHIGPLGPVDFVCVREGTEGLYSGIEYKLSEDVASAVRVITRDKSTKVARFSFEEARRRGWKRLVAINKANILKVSDGLFLEAVHAVGTSYPEIAVEDLYVDNFAQQLMKNPQRFDQTVVVGTNLFMDIVSEEASGLVGSYRHDLLGEHRRRPRDVRAGARQQPEVQGDGQGQPRCDHPLRGLDARVHRAEERRKGDLRRDHAGRRRGEAGHLRSGRHRGH